MRVTSIQIHNIPKSHQNFKSSRTVFDENGNTLYKTTTCFFRDDLDWSLFANYLGAHYRNVDKVNIINQACSSGKEPYSLAVILMHNLEKEAEKFLPIKAYDIDLQNIISAKSGRMRLTSADMYRINYYTKDNLRHYFNYNRTDNPDYDLVLTPKPILQDKVEFNQANILDDISYLKQDNTVLLCRNFWPYLNSKLLVPLAKNIYNKLGNNSLIVIGEYDLAYGIDNILYHSGFNGTGFKNILSKI